MAGMLKRMRYAGAKEDRQGPAEAKPEHRAGDQPGEKGGGAHRGEPGEVELPPARCRGLSTTGATRMHQLVQSGHRETEGGLIENLLHRRQAPQDHQHCQQQERRPRMQHLAALALRRAFATGSAG